eukprot:11171273-Karenia_brevis.AAC.1
MHGACANHVRSRSSKGWRPESMNDLLDIFLESRSLLVCNNIAGHQSPFTRVMVFTHSQKIG